MPNFVLTLKLKTQPFQEDILNKRLEIGRQIYNACLNELYKRYRAQRQSKTFKQACKMPKDKERSDTFQELNRQFGLTEYSLHDFVKPMQHYFKKHIDSQAAQKIATRCFKAFKKLMYGEAKKVHFKKYGQFTSLEGKSNKSGIKFRNNYLVWNKLSIPVIIKPNDIYAQMALMNKICYCRIVRKEMRGKYVYFVQLVLDGIPPVKIDNKTGRFKHLRDQGKVGIDIGTQTIAVVSDREAKLLELAPNVDNLYRQERILQRKLDRQRRANNPHKYNSDGTVKKNNKERWIHSKNYLKTRKKLADMKRKLADIRRQDHFKLANWILSLGDDIKVETMNYKALQARAKETTINKKTGKYNGKKRFGKSIANKAPSQFLTILKNKLEYDNNALKEVDTFKVKASQYNHFNNTYKKKSLSERWSQIDDVRIQRDLYSAFLIKNVKENLKEIDRESCLKEFNHFLFLHEKEINRLKENDISLVSSMGI